VRGRGSGRGRAGRPERWRLSSAVLGLCACVLACGHAATPRAAPPEPRGSARDEGILARLSAGPSHSRGETTGRAHPAARGGGRTTAATESASPYADYRFDRTPRHHSAPLPYARRYIPIAPTVFGSIEGIVVWPHPPRAPERLGAAPPAAPREGGSACPRGFPNPTLALAAGGGVANTVVYLEDVSTGRSLLGRTNSSPSSTKQLQIGGVLEWRECRFHPHVQIAAPIGSVLSLSSADEAVTVTATRLDGRTRETLWSVLLGAPGAGNEQLLDRDGLLELRADPAGQLASESESLPATGWIVVAQHPYFAITDELGGFVLDEVPPGAYTLVVWHEPVVVGLSRAGEPIVQSAPPVRRRVVVTARQAQRVTIRLPPAGEHDKH
jgi:hypothetical protein